jgi:hypothetical protein
LPPQAAGYRSITERDLRAFCGNPDGTGSARSLRDSLGCQSLGSRAHCQSSLRIGLRYDWLLTNGEGFGESLREWPLRKPAETGTIGAVPG